MLTATCLWVNAQTFVSTNPENKNVVLEEFTGIYCTYCPDGHVIAQQLADDNPGDVVLINVHVGSYADPGTSGNPDFRTPYGSALKDQSGLTGYPAGTINRHNYSAQGWSQDVGTAMGRSDWASAAAVAMGESSYVNIAAEASIDIITRVLTVNVEAYYTANGAASNNINVALIQNYVEGPQTGATSYNPDQILPNGNYAHMHMLRHFLTGQWGDVTTTTTSGSVYTNTFTYTIPADLNDVAYNLFDLEVVVFVAEGQQEIISGSKASMDYVIPPGTNLVDLGAATNMTMPSNYCDNSITPEITVTNNSSISVDTFEVYYILDGGAPVTQTGNNLAVSASTTITFPSITLTNGSHSLGYNVNTDNTTIYIDNVSGNNNAGVGTINTISSVAFAQSHTEGFESYSSGDDVINNAIVINDDAQSISVVNQGISTNVTWEIGGYGNSSNSFRLRFYSWPAGTEATLLFENIDLSTSTGNGLRFSYAYAQYTGENDQLLVMVSTDCGITWTTVHTNQGSSMATTAATTSMYYPAITEWDSTNISLSAYDGQSSVMIAFKGISDYGNNLYIDDIQISNTVFSAIDEAGVSSFDAVEVFPNPANDLAFVKVEMKETAVVKVEVRNVLSQLVQVVNDGELSTGSHMLTISTSELSEGLYYVNIYSDEAETTKKFVVVK